MLKLKAQKDLKKIKYMFQKVKRSEYPTAIFSDEENGCRMNEPNPKTYINTSRGEVGL